MKEFEANQETRLGLEKKANLEVEGVRRELGGYESYAGGDPIAGAYEKLRGEDEFSDRLHFGTDHKSEGQKKEEELKASQETERMLEGRDPEEVIKTEIAMAAAEEQEGKERRQLDAVEMNTSQKKLEIELEQKSK